MAGEKRLKRSNASPSKCSKGMKQARRINDSEENEGTFLLPVDVIYDNLFPFLEFSDLLRLRRVSKKTKDIADKFIRQHFRVHEREINESDCTIETYIQRNLPTCAIYINNTGPDFFENVKMTEFLRLYADGITHLRVNMFSACSTPAENNFFLALHNLQHLELQHTDARLAKCTAHFEENTINKETCTSGKIVETWYYPPTFRNLKTLKLNTMYIAGDFDQHYAEGFVNFCTQLEHLKHPSYRLLPFAVKNNNCHQSNSEPVDHVIEAVESRLEKTIDDQPPTLQIYDLEHAETISSWNLAKLCSSKNVRLLNVNAAFYDNVEVTGPSPDDDEVFSTMAPLMVSLKNVDRNMFGTELPNLERVVITSTADCSFDEFWEEDHPQWPKLTMLDINVNSMKLAESEEHESKPTTALLDFLFSSVEREKLRDLRIRFDQERLRTGNVCRMALPCPRVFDIVKNCSYVTKLTLTNWMGTSSALTKLWSGLPGLEEVAIEKCKLLEDCAFVGKNKDTAFLKLTELRKFALRGLDLMPKITDQIFVTVFRNLKIQEFEITSKTSLKSITINGIRSLLSGVFNASVIKFPFEGWSLENVSEEEFARLKSEFRASHML